MTVLSLQISNIQKKKETLLNTNHIVFYSNISNASIIYKESVHSIRMVECKCKGNNNDNRLNLPNCDWAASSDPTWIINCAWRTSDFLSCNSTINLSTRQCPKLHFAKHCTVGSTLPQTRHSTLPRILSRSA